MVLAGKIFNIKEDTDFNTIASKLKNLQEVDFFEDSEKKIELQTTVSELTLKENSLQGIFSQDQILQIYHRGQNTPIPKTLEVPFVLSKYKEKMYLLVLERKLLANNIANQLSKILFITTGNIVEAKISPDNLKKFHQENFEDTKIIFFDDVDVPNVDKLSLYGAGLGDTTLYADYSSHGNLWYTVLKSSKYGYVVGLTRKSTVTIFSKIERNDFITYIINEIFPLIG